MWIPLIGIGSFLLLETLICKIFLLLATPIWKVVKTPLLKIKDTLEAFENHTKFISGECTLVSRVDMQMGIVLLLICYFLRKKDVDVSIWSTEEDASRLALYYYTLPLATTCVLGTWRYAKYPILKDLHFLIRQHAQTVPFAMLATVTTMRFRDTIQLFPVQVECIIFAASALALVSYYLRNERLAILVQAPSLFIVTKDCTSQMLVHGVQRSPVLLLSAVLLILAKQAPLERILPFKNGNSLYAHVFRKLLSLLACFVLVSEASAWGHDIGEMFSSVTMLLVSQHTGNRIPAKCIGMDLNHQQFVERILQPIV
eukprot:gb/GECG01009874.1/.p1 GENE.gb/GECG01009874.1/~~gb/GECG01009874.1/.p1  ORF type:complete len:314 (+),score=17.14 gb/GECG01009874.1/:1-942(+)